ncbi:MAG TPA: DUF6600 domain-containing protein [Verrucomicrobiae bacterium]|nr:DUF6600 domain-containing protein [Verrucomicrobiae bacterium]
MRTGISRSIAILAVAVALTLSGVLVSPAEAGVSFDLFYSNLSPHGTWQVSAQYGRVWRPSVETPGWSPYVDGHWVYTDLGWSWVSDYPWGAIPYHYGTWVADPESGWVWVPGYTWAPAWVTFRSGPDYVGWAPVAPGFNVGVSVGLAVPVASSFVFVSCHDFLSPSLHGSVIPYSRATGVYTNTRVVNNLTVRNNVVVNRGLDVTTIARASGRRVEAVPIERVSRVAPEGRFNRSEIAVGGKGSGHGLRAAEPVAASRPIPGSSRRDEPGPPKSSPHAVQGKNGGGVPSPGRRPDVRRRELKPEPEMRRAQAPPPGRAARRPEAGTSGAAPHPQVRPARNRSGHPLAKRPPSRKPHESR